MKLKKLLFVSVLILMLGISGCQSPIHQMQTRFDETEFSPYATPGSATIRGEAFLKTRGGEVRYGAGNTVTLMPVTSYSREIWQAALQGKVTDKDPRWEKYIRTTVADGTGKFEFTKLPAGEYFLECPIFWEVPDESSLYPRLKRTGAVLKKQVRIDNSAEVRVIMTE